MTTQHGSTIRLLPSGVPGLDTVLGGGLPEYSFNLIAGEPGAGKTTLAQQIAFSRASAEAPALYFTRARRAAAQDAAARAAVQLLRQGQARQRGHVREPQRRGDGSRPRQHHEAHARRGRRGPAGDGRRRLVSHGRATPARPRRSSRSSCRSSRFTSPAGKRRRSSSASTTPPNRTATRSSRSPTASSGSRRAIERSACVRRMQVTKMRACAHDAGASHARRSRPDGVRVFPRILPRTEPRPRAAQGRRAHRRVSRRSTR